MKKNKLLILSGQGVPAIRALNIYMELLTDTYDNIVIVEERNITPEKILIAIQRRFKKLGFFSVINFILLRIIKLFFFKEQDIKKRYLPTLCVNEINDEQVKQLIKNLEPDLIITNACSILRKELLASISCPIINVHNGVNPRYRGTGNLWAFYENNPFFVGTTTHYIDKGIDTGQRIAIQKIDFRECKVHFEDIDHEAFAVGANMVVDLLHNNPQSIPIEFSHLPDRLYTYPGLSHYLVARRNYNRFIEDEADIEQIWHQSFCNYAMDETKSKYQRMHWGDDTSVLPRDNLIKALYLRYYTPEMKVIDIGCGDGRYKTLLDAKHYVGCDFSIELLKFGLDNNQLVQCYANKLPFKDNSFDMCLAIGLFQHLEYSEKVANEIQSITRPNGIIIINTLRQFSLSELIIIGLFSLFNKNRLALVWAVLRKDYFNGKEVNNTLVARRYTLTEILRNFNFNKSAILSVNYNGVLGTSFLSREITIVLQNLKIS